MILNCKRSTEIVRELKKICLQMEMFVFRPPVFKLALIEFILYMFVTLY